MNLEIPKSIFRGLVEKLKEIVSKKPGPMSSRIQAMLTKMEAKSGPPRREYAGGVFKFAMKAPPYTDKLSKDPIDRMREAWLKGVKTAPRRRRPAR